MAPTKEAGAFAGATGDLLKRYLAGHLPITRLPTTVTHRALHPASDHPEGHDVRNREFLFRPISRILCNAVALQSRTSSRSFFVRGQNSSCGRDGSSASHLGFKQHAKLRSARTLVRDLQSYFFPLGNLNAATPLVLTELFRGSASCGGPPKRLSQIRCRSTPTRRQLRNCATRSACTRYLALRSSGLNSDSSEGGLPLLRLLCRPRVAISSRTRFIFELFFGFSEDFKQKNKTQEDFAKYTTGKKRKKRKGREGANLERE